MFPLFCTNLVRELIALCVGKGSNPWNARRVFLSYTVFLEGRQEVREPFARGHTHNNTAMRSVSTICQSCSALQSPDLGTHSNSTSPR